MKPGPASDLELLDYIQECIERVEEYTQRGKSKFMDSMMMQDATARKLQVMAESTQRLSDEIKATEPEIPWSQIAGFRNTLVHGYLDIDLELTWVVVDQDMPILKAAVIRMHQKLRGIGQT